MRALSTLLIGTGLLVFAACSSSRSFDRSSVNVSSNYCQPSVRYSGTTDTAPLKDTDALLAANTGLPEHVVLMANATGTLALIRQFEQTTDRAEKTEIRSKIEQRLLLASAEIEGISAELDCEGEKADQLAGYLDAFNSKRNTQLTVASIVVGALTTIATVAIKDDGPQAAVAIGGGLLSAGLVAATVVGDGKTIELEHPRNTLRDIWEEPASSAIYPPFVWYVLTEKRFSNSREIALVASIKERWKSFDFGGRLKAADVTLFFGMGGTYAAGDLHTRAAMLNELQATIRSVNQDLDRLLRYLVTIDY